MLFFFHKKNYMPIYFVYYIYHVHPPKKNYAMCIVISKSYILFCLIKLLYLKTLKTNNVFRKYNSFGFFYYARTILSLKKLNCKDNVAQGHSSNSKHFIFSLFLLLSNSLVTKAHII